MVKRLTLVFSLIGQAAHWKNLELVNSRLTSEVTSLRARHASVEVLREEKRSLEIKLQKASEQTEQLARLQGEVEAARKEREDWSVHTRISESLVIPLTYRRTQQIGLPSLRIQTPNRVNTPQLPSHMRSPPSASPTLIY